MSSQKAADPSPCVDCSSSDSPAAFSQSNTSLQAWKLIVIIGSLCLGVFLYGLDVNIVGVAIPRITTDFGSLDNVAWYGSAYLLSVTAFQPGFGTVYKYFNAKWVYMASLLIFEVSSAICAAAPSSNVLIFGRALLGVGAAGLLQGALAIIGNVVPLQKVPQYQGIVISAMGISVCLGPVIGGAIVQYANWRWCFWINVPVGVFVIIVILLFVPMTQHPNSNTKLPVKEKLRHVDVVGSIIFLGTICCLLLALTWGGQKYPWRSSQIIGLFVGFGLLTILFSCWTWRQGDATLIPLRILRKRSIMMGALTLFGLGMVMNVYGYYLPLLFQAVQSVSTTMSGVRYIALIVPQIVSVGLTGAVVSKWGYYYPYMVAGVVIAAVGAGFVTTIDIHTATANWAAYLVITGVGIGMSMQIPYAAVQVVLESTDVATGNAIAVFSSQLAAAVGLAIGQTLLIQGLYDIVPAHTSAVSPAQVVAAGASGLIALADGDFAVLEALREAYRGAIRRILIQGLAAICFALPPAVFMERLNIKREAANRKEKTEVEVLSSRLTDEEKGK